MSEKLSNALDAANVKRTEAEAEMLDADRRLKDAETKLKEAETAQKIAHAKTAEYGAESMRVQTESTLRQETLALASNHLWHEYHFIGDVCWDSVEPCLSQLAVWHRLNPECNMHIIINSDGGTVVDGLHLFDQLTAYSIRGRLDKDGNKITDGKHHVKITVRGMAASMAGVLVQAADERVIGPESYLMVHQVSSWNSGSLGDLKDKMKWLDMLTDRFADVFVARSGGKMDKDYFDHSWERKDWYIAADDALRLGLVDRIG